MNASEILQVGWSLRNRLLALPESGLGYQVVTLEKLGTFVVLNAQLAVRITEEDSREFRSQPVRRFGQHTCTSRQDRPRG